MALKTYTSTRANPLAFLEEAYRLYKFKSRDIPGQVEGTIAYMRGCEERIRAATGIALQGKKILIVGPGQTPREMVYLGCRNEVVGIDLDVIPETPGLGSYIKMARQNGVMRTVKTAARKSLGIDSRFNSELKRQLGIEAMPKASYLQMDAAKMEFPDHSFDFVYSFSVFEHLPDPRAVISETARVLKPGGGCYISLHLYTSENGCHDLRLFSEDRPDIPFWPHLRPQYEALIHPNAYLNKIRIPGWEGLFEERLPGAKFEFDYHQPKERAAGFEKELAAIRSQGELGDYTDNELLAVNLIAIWQKSADK